MYVMSIPSFRGKIEEEASMRSSIFRHGHLDEDEHDEAFLDSRP
jgi:hypothetical protein